MSRPAVGRHPSWRCRASGSARPLAPKRAQFTNVARDHRAELSRRISSRVHLICTSPFTERRGADPPTHSDVRGVKVKPPTNHFSDLGRGRMRSAFLGSGVRRTAPRWGEGPSTASLDMGTLHRISEGVSSPVAYRPSQNVRINSGVEDQVDRLTSELMLSKHGDSHQAFLKHFGAVSESANVTL